MSVHSFVRFVTLCILLSLLSGCASLFSSPPVVMPPRETLDRFALEGRFSLYHESRNYSGRISWTHRGASSELLLSSPFGQGIAEIVTDERGAKLTTGDGKVYAAPDAETLTQDVLGYPLPLTQLADWVRGWVKPGAAHLDAQGRAVRLQQAEWVVDYEYGDTNPGSPPVRIVARRGEMLELRVFVQEWRSLSNEEATP